MKAASAALKKPFWVLQWAKENGCRAFRSNRVYGAELLRWLKANKLPKVATSQHLKEQLLVAKIRNLRGQNDRVEQAHVSREWVHERSERIVASLKRISPLMIDKHVLLFPATAPADIASNRAILWGIWSDVIACMQTLADGFKNP